MKQKRKNKIKYRIAGILILALMAFLIGNFQWKHSQERLAEDVLRFHILANSDSDMDQQLKLKVRDAVGGFLGEKLQNASSREESEKIVASLMPEIVACAQTVIYKEGYQYPVTAAIETVDFPEKTYGGYTFPSGSYRALRILIGEGKGHNWWCVMYPDMCFSDSVYKVTKDESGEKLSEVLTLTEYQKVIADTDKRIEFKWLPEIE